MRERNSKFWLVKCNSCGNEQVIFGCAATQVRCIVCNDVIAKPQAHKTKLVNAKKLREY